MPYLTQRLGNDGPLVEVEVAVTSAFAHSLLNSGQSVPGPFRMPALIDTGATYSCIDHHWIQMLGVQPIGSSTLMVPAPIANTHQFNQYHVRVTLLHAQLSYSVPILPVVAASIANQGIGLLLGRDLLQHCLLIYDGQAGTFSLAF